MGTKTIDEKHNPIQSPSIQTSAFVSVGSLWPHMDGNPSCKTINYFLCRVGVVMPCLLVNITEYNLLIIIAMLLVWIVDDDSEFKVKVVKSFLETSKMN